MNIQQDISSDVLKIIETNSFYQNEIEKFFNLLNEYNEIIYNLLENLPNDNKLKVMIKNDYFVLYIKNVESIKYRNFILKGNLIYNDHNVPIFQFKKIKSNVIYKNLGIPLQNFSSFGILDSNIGRISIQKYLNNIKKIENEQTIKESVTIQLINILNILNNNKLKISPYINGFIELENYAYIPIYHYSSNNISVLYYYETKYILIIGEYNAKYSKNHKTQIFNLLDFDYFNINNLKYYSHNHFLSSNKEINFIMKKPECIISDNLYFKEFCKKIKIKVLSKKYLNEKLFSLLENIFSQYSSIDTRELIEESEYFLNKIKNFFSFYIYLIVFVKKINKVKYNQSNLYKNYTFESIDKIEFAKIIFMIEKSLVLYSDIKDYLIYNEINDFYEDLEKIEKDNFIIENFLFYINLSEILLN